MTERLCLNGLNHSFDIAGFNFCILCKQVSIHLCFKRDSTNRDLNYWPLSVLILLGDLPSTNMFFKAFITDSPLLSFSCRSHMYLEKMSIATNIKLYSRLYFENFVISIKSTSHWSSMPITTTLFLLTGLFIDLCRLYGSCRCSHFFILCLVRTNFPSFLTICIIYLGR